MRVAPAVCAHLAPEHDVPMRIYEFARGISWTTHGHPDAYVPAAAFATVLHSMLWGCSVVGAIKSTTAVLTGDNEADRTNVLLRCLAEGMPLSADPVLRCTWDRPAVRALSIALCCARDHYDFHKAVTRALAHGFDSAVVGSLTGQLAGAACGELHLPPFLLAPLELRDVISALADDLASFLGWDWDRLESDETWERYPGW